MREQLKDNDAIDVLRKALEIDPSNDDLIKLYEETKQEYEEDNNLPIDHPERARFERML